MEIQLNQRQRTVLLGAAAGLVCLVSALLWLPGIMPRLADSAGSGDRLAFGAKWLALEAVPLFVAIVAVGNARFSSGAIDPTAMAESPAMQIDGRVVENTLQQFALFATAILADCAILRGSELSLVAAASSIFVVSRFAFWIGYRIHPLYRAFGFASSVYLNLILFGIAACRGW